MGVISSHAIYPGGGLKLERIEAVPSSSSSCTKPSSLFLPTVDNDIHTTQQQFWVVSESHSLTHKGNFLLLLQAIQTNGSQHICSQLTERFTINASIFIWEKAGGN